MKFQKFRQNVAEKKTPAGGRGGSQCQESNAICHAHVLFPLRDRGGFSPSGYLGQRAGAQLDHSVAPPSGHIRTAHS
jgi:hypothetical protein